jgi:hypothetical protein
MNNMEKEKELQELQEIAKQIMQSESLEASVEILRRFADKCWLEGACEAQNDAFKYMRENTVHLLDIPIDIQKLIKVANKR